MRSRAACRSIDHRIWLATVSHYVRRHFYSERTRVRQYTRPPSKPLFWGMCSVSVVYFWRWYFHRAQHTHLWETRTFLKWFVIWNLSLYVFFLYPNQQVKYWSGIKFFFDLYCNFLCLPSSFVTELDSFISWCTLFRLFFCIDNSRLWCLLECIRCFKIKEKLFLFL